MKKIVDENGNTVQSVEPVVLKQTISRQTSDTVRQYLYSVVSEGTGKSAKVDGYSMGGKTGTAQKGNRDDKKYVVSFIGFAPVENPEVLVYVVIDEANVPIEQQSSSLATELAKEIFTEILPYLNVFQDEETESGEEPEGTENLPEGDNPAGTENSPEGAENPSGEGEPEGTENPPEGTEIPPEGGEPEGDEESPEEGGQEGTGSSPEDEEGQENPGGDEYPTEGVPEAMPEGAENPVPEEQ